MAQNVANGDCDPDASRMMNAMPKGPVDVPVHRTAAMVLSST